MKEINAPLFHGGNIPKSEGNLGFLLVLSQGNTFETISPLNKNRLKYPTNCSISFTLFLAATMQHYCMKNEDSITVMAVL